MRERVKVAVRQAASRPFLQGAWHQLAKLSHAGMNYGGGQMVDDSGELEALRYAAQALHPPAPFVLFDAGANTGAYLAGALALLGTEVRAFAFEPQPVNLAVLQKQFDADGRVVLQGAALSSRVGTASLFYEEDGEPTASFHGPGSRSRAVPVTTVDAMCREHGLDRIDMLKIDTEGHEMEVLAGAAESLAAGRIGAVQVEFGETWVDTPYHFQDLYRLLAPRFRLFRILRRGLVELHHYSYDLEVYKLSNFLGVRREH